MFINLPWVHTNLMTISLAINWIQTDKLIYVQQIYFCKCTLILTFQLFVACELESQCLDLVFSVDIWIRNQQYSFQNRDIHFQQFQHI